MKKHKSVRLKTLATRPADLKSDKPEIRKSQIISQTLNDYLETRVSKNPLLDHFGEWKDLGFENVYKEIISKRKSRKKTFKL